MKVLVIDNYDSFVYNLVQYIGELGSEVIVYRNDQIKMNQIQKIKPDRIIISPGPGNPVDEKYFGICKSILLQISPTVPTLGVCLGHQGIISSYGGKIINAKQIMHGKTSRINHDGQGIFRDIANPFIATRYHSLTVDKFSIPSCIKVTAFSIDDNEVMGIRHIHYPIVGIQFHPESILCDYGKLVIKNFLEGDC